jgi:hypothetical protein
MYQMHRIFCATPWELEAERMRFHEILGRFNETDAMPKGVLFVPVTLAGIRDKRPLQYTIDENIRQCRHYLLVLSDEVGGWGPTERNFRHDYSLALECAADAAEPMQSAAILTKGHAAPDLPQPAATFATRAEFDACLNRLFSEWLASC